MFFNILCCVHQEGGKEEVSPPEPGNSTSVEVTKLLEPYTNYSFYIRVWNNYGPSDQSATILCSTDPSGALFFNVNFIINVTKSQKYSLFSLFSS